MQADQVGRGACAAWRAMRSLSLAVAGLALSCAVSMPVVAHAGEPPGINRKVTLMAREQPLAAFLQQLFAGIEVPVSVSPSAQGVVNGRFEGTVQTVLRDISRSFSLSAYFDGAAMHLYPASEIGTRTYATDAAQAKRIHRTATELGLPDARNTLRSTQGGTLVAIGGPRFLQQMDDLVRADATQSAGAAGRSSLTAGGAPSAPNTVGFRVFYLKHAWAQDTRLAFGGRQVVIPGVASVLRSITSGLGQTIAQPLPPGAGLVVPGDALAPASDRLLPPVQPRLKGSGLAGTGQRLPTLGESDDAAGAARQRGLPSNVVIGADGTQALQRYVVNQVGAVRIEADPRSNAVIVRDVVERLPMYEQLIASLDFPPQMIEVEATIVDVNITRLEQLGINWRWINGRNEVLFGNGSASDLLLNPGRQITPAGAGMFISTVLGDSFNFISRINALSNEGAARVVSRPQLVTLSNVEAIFDSSSTFYVRVAGREEVDLFNVSAGTSLRVTPNVFQDGDGARIKLMVSVEDGRISGETVDQIPVVDRSTVNTQALMLEGESLLIGGMTREGSDRKVDKVPLLGDLPAIGALFRSKADSSTRIERLILITPRLIDARRSPAVVGTVPAQPSTDPRAASREPSPPAQLRPPIAPAAAPVASAMPTPVPTPMPTPVPTRMPASAPTPALSSAPSAWVPTRPMPALPAAVAPAPQPGTRSSAPADVAAGSAGRVAGAAGAAAPILLMPTVTQSWPAASRPSAPAPAPCYAQGGEPRC